MSIPTIAGSRADKNLSSALHHSPGRRSWLKQRVSSRARLEDVPVMLDLATHVFLVLASARRETPVIMAVGLRGREVNRVIA